MATTELRLELFGPGMTPLHRAGLGGLAASLKALRLGDVPGLSWNLEPHSITLQFEEDDAQALVRLVEASMYCDSGLIAFKAFEDLPEYTQQARLHMNECLLGTLLQHNKALQPPGAKKTQKTVEVGGRQFVFSVKDLSGFKHRSAPREDGLVDSYGRLTTKSIRVKGWALPGAVQRHDTASDTALAEPPDRFLALVFALIGVVPFRLHASRRREKLAFALVVPEVDDLECFAETRRRLVGSVLSLSASSAGDAALRMYAALQTARVLRRLRVRSCSVVALGSLPWTGKQKTRTEVLSVAPPDGPTLDRLEVIDREMSPRLRPKKDGTSFVDFPAWRQLHSAEKPELQTNRRWDDQTDNNSWQDEKWKGWAEKDGNTFIDDDVLGFMKAEGAKSDGSDRPAGGRAKGTIDKRRGALEVTRAVSSLPFAGDLSFNARSGDKGSTSLYGTEMHATRYQYGFSLTPGHLREPGRLSHVIQALVSLGEVAGSHSRFLYDFSPESVIFRWTHDPAPRLLYCFDEAAEPPSVSELVRRVKAGDVDARELIVGDALLGTPDGLALKAAGAEVVAGVKAAAGALSKRVEHGGVKS